MKPTKTLAERPKETDSDKNVVASVEFVIRTELHDSAEADFVHLVTKRKSAIFPVSFMERRTSTLRPHSFPENTYLLESDGICVRSDRTTDSESVAQARL